jgi:hypothetical protein
MRNDPLRGLIEAITNADDSYGDEEGPILIRLPKPEADGWAFMIADRAHGIAHEEMERKLLKWGEATSGHERGESKRGNRGRGAKDLAAFGKVRWDSIHEGHYSWLYLGSDGRGRQSEKPVNATNELRKQLGTQHDGTVVTVTCRRTQVTRPQKDRLKQRLERCVPLRDIMLNEHRVVRLQYAEDPPVRLTYVPPAGAKELERVQVPIEGYPGLASVCIQEVSAPFSEDPTDLCRESGLLIKSGRAVHEATLFSFESNPYAGFFLGEVRWDTIDDLSRQYDSRDELGEPHPPENDRPVIPVDRDGLDRRHPAYRALRRAAEGVLRKHFARKAEEARGSANESVETRRRLSDLARVVARFRSDKNEEFELEDPLRYTATGTLDPQVPDLAVIPPVKVMEQATQHTFTIQVRQDSAAEPEAKAHLAVISDPDALIQLSSEEVELVSSQRHQGVLRGTFRVDAGNVNGQAHGEVTVEGLRPVTLDITVVEPAIVLPPEPPLTFMFEKPQYVVPSGRKRTILVLAPTVAVAKHGSTMLLTNSNPQGLLIRHMRLELAPSRDGDWYQVPIEVEGRQHGAKATLAAHLGSSPLKDRTNITIGRAQSGPPIPQIKIDSLPGYQRGSWDVDDDGQITITINATHAAVQRYFGAAPDFVNQEGTEARLIMAEVVADLVVRDLILRRYRAREIEVTSMFAERARMLSELLPSCHSSLLSDGELNRVTSGATETQRKPQSSLQSTKEAESR